MQQLTSVRLPAILDNVPLTMDTVIGAVSRLGLDERTLQQIRLVVDEACANVVTHAYEGMEPGDMEIACYHDPGWLVISVRDWGQGFSLEQIPAPDLDAPLEDRSLGGLGLFLVRHFMDRVEYSCDAGRGNELTMVKRL